jgi:mannitol/fructose-specific phosphotransferase system IIA component (Ntr-type)
MSESRFDLAILVRETKLLAKQAGLDVRVYLAGPAAAEVQKRYEQASPGVETTFVVTDTWKEARQTFFGDVKDSDLVVLPQSRRDSALWTPTLDRLPELMAGMFPRTNLLVIYPSLLGEKPLTGPVALPASQSFPALRGVDLDTAFRDQERITRLVQGGLPEDPAMAAEAIPLLVDSANLTPVDLADGVLLLHAHCGDRESPMLLVGYGRGEGAFFAQPESPHLLLALLSPRGDAPELHLRSLAQVAKRFRTPEVVSALPECRKASDVCSLLSPN